MAYAQDIYNQTQYVYLTSVYNQLLSSLYEAVSLGAVQYNVLPEMQYVSANMTTQFQQDVSSCLAACQATSNCSGATYASDTQTCNLVVGAVGQLGPADAADAQNTSAIVSSIVSILQEIETVNGQLGAVASAIILDPSAYDTTDDALGASTRRKKALVEEEYKKILQDKRDIAGMLARYYSINQEYQSSILDKDMKVEMWRMWVSVSVLLVLATVALLAGVVFAEQ